MKRLALVATLVLMSISTGHAEDYLHGQSGTTYQDIGNTTYGSDCPASRQPGQND